jgi:hypothetical protein
MALLSLFMPARSFFRFLENSHFLLLIPDDNKAKEIMGCGDGETRRWDI